MDHLIDKGLKGVKNLKTTKWRILAGLAATLTSAISLSPISDASPSDGAPTVPYQWSEAPKAWLADDSRDDEGVAQDKNGAGFTPYAFRETGAPGTCRLVVWDIGWDQSKNWLGIQGGRQNCPNNTAFSVGLRKDLSFRPDPIIGSVTGVNNQIVRAFGACQGAGNYYGRVASNTGNSLRGDNSGACR